MLPFIDPEDDIYINFCVVLILLERLAKTSRGTLKINNGKLHIFLYLLKNPVMLNIVLTLLGKENATLNDYETYSVTSISPNLEPLYDRKSLKVLISVLIAKEYVQVKYKSGDGFFYSLSVSGEGVVSSLQGEYISEIKILCEKLKPILSLTESQLSKTVNQVIRMEAI